MSHHDEKSFKDKVLERKNCVGTEVCCGRIRLQGPSLA